MKQQVKVRKYDVDIKTLQQLLRTHKSETKLSNKQIAERLDKPITLVEHWFRTDNCFSIPDEDIWFDLKELLNIEDDSFDKSITTFVYREGVFEKAERCYFDCGIAPTITTLSANEKIILTENYLKRQETVIVEDFYKSRPVRIYEDYAPCLRSERTGLKVGIIEKDNTQ